MTSSAESSGSGSTAVKLQVMVSGDDGGRG